MRMLKNYLNLEMTKGDTLSFGIEINKIGKALDAAYFTCKKHYDDETIVFQKALNNGITLDHYDSDGNYFYKLRVAPTDTQNLEIGKYYYDVEIDVNDDVFTIMRGILTLEFDVKKGR